MMVANKKIIAQFLIFTLLIFMLVGCSQDNSEEVTLSGVVTEGRASTGLEGVKVKVGDNTAITDENGKFNLSVSEGTYDLIAIKKGYGSVRYQNVNLENEDSKEFEIVMMTTGKSLTEPPTIDLSGVERNEVLSGEIEYKVDIDSPLEINYSQVKLKKSGYEVDRQIPELTQFEDVINTNNFTDGKTTFTIEVIDVNNNITKLDIPVNIHNGIDENVEAPAAPQMVQVMSMSWGKSVEFFSEDKEVTVSANNDRIDRNKITVEPQNVENDQLIYNYLILPPPGELENVKGYQVLRSFDGENYEVLGEVQKDIYFDFDAEIEPKEPVYYKVKAYNDGGLSEATDPIMVKPLPKINVELFSPADEAEGVSIDPEFSWELSRDLLTYEINGEEYREQAIYILDVYDYNLGSWDSFLFSIDDTTVNYSTIAEGEVLANNTRYHWDIVPGGTFEQNGEEQSYESKTEMSYQYNGHYVILNSYFGYRSGSLNGEFSFITEEN